MPGIAPQLLADLDAGCTVILPTRQRAAAVRLSHALAQLERSRTLWRTADVISWSAWLEREALRASEGGERIPRLLRTAEEWWLWREATYEAAAQLGIGAGEALVQGLHNAAQLLSAWQIPSARLEDEGGAESALLARALKDFEARAHELRAMGSHQLARQVRGIGSPRSLSFAGFLEHTPARQELMRAWSARSCIVRDRSGASLASSKGSTRMRVATAATAQEELHLAAKWCRRKLLEDPRQRLLVVVPELEQQGQEVLRVFEQALAPQAVLGHTSAHSAEDIFAIEGGGSLAHFPLVQHALTGLKFLTQSIEFSELSAWLRTAFWALPEEAPRARLEAWLRGRLDIAADLASVLHALSQASPGTAQAALQLRGALHSAVRALGEAGEPAQAIRLSAHQWARRFAQALLSLGWPGARTLSSAEQQTKTRFLEALDEYASLGATLGPMNAVDAVRTLRELITRISFQPATGDPAVTVSSALADPVVHYDGIWVTGLHADLWPRPARFDPFIPIAAQKQAGITASHPAHLLQQARKLMGTWQSCAAELVLSWPHSSEDCERLMSPLLRELERKAVHDPKPEGQGLSLARSLRSKAPVALESFEDRMGEAWPRGVELPAGTRSIEYQARCPFRAYAQLRLNCTPLEQPFPGVDPRNRGWLLHAALEHLWRQLGDSRGLHAAHREQRLEMLIDRCVAQALVDIFPGQTEAVQAEALSQGRGMLAREHRRAAYLMGELCALELERPAFRVRALEEKCELQIGGAQLTLRIDRIDELEEGGLVIFDYKSGRPESPDWFGERLTHPQLLVYLLATREPVMAVANVHLRPAAVSYRGIADRKQRLPKIEALFVADDPTQPTMNEHSDRATQAWMQQVERWREAIGRLTQAFLAGDAALDPAEHVCRNCHLHVFCRIAERG